MRSFVATALFASLALALLGACSAEDGSLLIGYRQAGDRLLSQETVQKGANYITKRDETVTLTGDGYSTITRVEIIDTKKNGNTYTPKILAGGPGNTFVTIKLQSHRAHGLHYLIRIYGR